MLSFMQALTPSLSMGGTAQYHTDKGSLNTAYGGVFDKGENLIAAQWDSNVSMFSVCCSVCDTSTHTHTPPALYAVKNII
jgi:hypothetical protein